MSSVPDEDPPKVSLVKDELAAIEKIARMKVRQQVLTEADYIVLIEFWRICHEKRK